MLEFFSVLVLIMIVPVPLACTNLYLSFGFGVSDLYYFVAKTMLYAGTNKPFKVGIY